ncbi:MAG: SpoIIE family protein phosphatase [Lachnospiraceae bacterium]|jgi:serine phosphatase RsbU (regulator of sigma subunit)|nr:SpoIIE family protein phosphatase [Lachnospiraceae bacterium]
MDSQFSELVVQTILLTIPTAVLCLTDRFRLFGKHRLVRRLLAGALCGTAAALCAGKTAPAAAAVLTVRDIPILTASLFFDPWSGAIAAAVCAVFLLLRAGSALFALPVLVTAALTLFIGFSAFLLATFIFEGRRPSGIYCFAIGAITEVFRVLAILLVQADTAAGTFDTLRNGTGPLLLIVSIGLSLQSAVVYLLSGSLRRVIRRRKPSEFPVTVKFQLWLFLFIAVVFVITLFATYRAQSNFAVKNAQNVLKVNARDLERVISQNSSNLDAAKQLLVEQGKSLGRAAANDIRNAGGADAVTDEEITRLVSEYKVYEIDVINAKGIVTACNNRSHDGYDMADGVQSSAFLVLLDGRTREYVQDFQPISFDSKVSIMFIGIAMEDGFVQIGYDKSSIENVEKLADISNVATSRRIGEKGSVYVVRDGSVLSGSDISGTVPVSKIGLSEMPQDDTFFYAKIMNADCYCYSVQQEDYQLLLCMTADEMNQTRDVFLYEAAFAELLLFAVIFIQTYVLVRRLIVRNLEMVNRSLNRISGGDLNEVVDVRSSEEFTSLSKDINSTVDTLKRYIKEAENRMAQELELAKEIQKSALPVAFTGHSEFDLGASMTPAKEVGGDFYDYFFTDETHLALVIADVSGKGIPAALFMMKSKTLIKNLAGSGKTPGEIMTLANSELCDGNEAQMFVTAWIGIVDLRTGTMTCANAGHEYPAYMPAGGEYEILHGKHDFVLGGMEGLKYREYTLEMHPGDRLFVYTDGVTEAIDSSETLYGLDRLKAALDRSREESSSAQLASVKADIDAFAGQTPQFDDITMLSFQPKIRL